MVVVALVDVGWNQEENMSGRKESAVDAAVCALLVGKSAVVGVWLGTVGWSQEENMSGRRDGALGGTVCVLLVAGSGLMGA
jgi:hypothetical protein